MPTTTFSAAQNQASTLYLPPGSWLTVLDCLCEHFSAIGREQWLDRIARGRVLDGQGQPISLTCPTRKACGFTIFVRCRTRSRFR